MRGKKAEDLTGRKFGKLTVIDRAVNDKFGAAQWNCVCECGSKIIVRAHNLKRGIANSCGCGKGCDVSIYTVGDVGIYLLDGGKKGYFWFDAEDLEFVQSRRWGVEKNGYVVSQTPSGKFTRLLLGITDPAIKVDHINGDMLDNRKCNLRPCTHAENMKHITTGVTGIDKRDNGKFRAKITCNKKQITIGTFDTYEEAVIAREAKAKELFGEFAPKPKIIFFPGLTG